jgi:acetyl esterase
MERPTDARPTPSKEIRMPVVRDPDTLLSGSMPIHLDPDVEAAIALDPDAPGTLPLADLRAEHDRNIAETVGAPEPVESVSHFSIPEHDLELTCYQPADVRRPVPGLVFFHGGGWVVGSRGSHDPIARAIANRSRSVVISVEYRLAPEHPFPRPVEDAVFATRWVLDHARRLGVDPDHIGVGGDSAGGNLAAVVAWRLRDEDRPLACQFLLYPVTSALQDTPSYQEFAAGFGLTAADMAWFWSQYLGPSGDPKDPNASPLLVSDTTRLAPGIIVSAEADVLRDEAEAYADRLRGAGVPVVGIRSLGMPHAFLNFLGTSPAARSLLGMVARELGERLSIGVEWTPS